MSVYLYIHMYNIIYSVSQKYARDVVDWVVPLLTLASSPGTSTSSEREWSAWRLMAERSDGQRPQGKVTDGRSYMGFDGGLMVIQ